MEALPDTPLPTISGATHLYGIMGYPVTHSWSPLMQTFAFRQHGLDCVYVPFSVAPDQLARAVAGAVALGVHGFNVTIPHKEAIMAHLDAISPEAQFIGAVNTVVMRDGQLSGHNTDGIGFLQPLQELQVPLTASAVCVVGAGGAARALTMALLGAGCPALTVTNRTAERAERLVAALQKRFPQAEICAVPFEAAPERAKRCEIVVNATSVGLNNTTEVLLPETCFRPGQIVYDIVYRPFDTALLQVARRCGATVIPGLDMLIGQGAVAFQIWTDLPFPVAAVRQRLHAMFHAA